MKSQVAYTKAGTANITIAFDGETAVITTTGQSVNASAKDASAMGFKLERMGYVRSDSEAAILLSALTVKQGR